MGNGACLTGRKFLIGSQANRYAISQIHSCLRCPAHTHPWIPAFAGMTELSFTLTLSLRERGSVDW